MFYMFDQNNSGGVYLKPALYVFIEANNADEANFKALDYIYFDGCRKGLDCDCCGDRWHPVYSDADGCEQPEVYGRPIAEYKPYGDGRAPAYLIVKADGTKILSHS